MFGLGLLVLPIIVIFLIAVIMPRVRGRRTKKVIVIPATTHNHPEAYTWGLPSIWGSDGGLKSDERDFGYGSSYYLGEGSLVWFSWGIVWRGESSIWWQVNLGENDSSAQVPIQSESQKLLSSEISIIPCSKRDVSYAQEMPDVKYSCRADLQIRGISGESSESWNPLRFSRLMY